MKLPGVGSIFLLSGPLFSRSCSPAGETTHSQQAVEESGRRNKLGVRRPAVPALLLAGSVPLDPYFSHWPASASPGGLGNTGHWPLSQTFWLSRSGLGQIICISKKLPCGAAAAGLGPISFVFLICKSGTVTLVPLASHICADKKVLLALAGVAQWIECWPANHKVTGSIPSQGPCLGCGPGPH